MRSLLIVCTLQLCSIIIYHMGEEVSKQQGVLQEMLPVESISDPNFGPV